MTNEKHPAQAIADIQAAAFAQAAQDADAVNARYGDYTANGKAATERAAVYDAAAKQYAIDVKAVIDAERAKVSATLETSVPTAEQMQIIGWLQGCGNLSQIEFDAIAAKLPDAYCIRRALSIKANDCRVQYGFIDATTMAGHVDALEAAASGFAMRDGADKRAGHARMLDGEWLERFTAVYDSAAGMPAFSAM